MTMFDLVLNACNFGVPEAQRVKVVRDEESGFIDLHTGTIEFGVFRNEREAQSALLLFLQGKTAGVALSTERMKRRNKTFMERLFG